MPELLESLKEFIRDHHMRETLGRLESLRDSLRARCVTDKAIGRPDAQRQDSR